MVIALRSFGEPNHLNADELLSCLGHYETSFGMDLSASFCSGLQPWSASWLFCKTMLVIHLFTNCNLPEIYLLWKCIKAIQNQTRDVKSLLTLTAFERRKRLVLKINYKSKSTIPLFQGIQCHVFGEHHPVGS